MKRSKLIIFLAITIIITIFLLTKGIIVFDHSGERRGEGVYWNDCFYIACSGQYTEGKTIAKTTDGWRINKVEEDPSNTFIVLRSFLDQYLLVKEDYTIPTSGEISCVYWNRQFIDNTEFIHAVSDIVDNATYDFTHNTDGIFQLKDGQNMRLLCLGYDNCPIATESIGYMGTINGVWCITTNQPIAEFGKVNCYTIPDEYTKILSKYLPDN